MARYVLLTIALLAFCAAAMAQMWPPGVPRGEELSKAASTQTVGTEAVDYKKSGYKRKHSHKHYASADYKTKYDDGDKNKKKSDDKKKPDDDKTPKDDKKPEDSPYYKSYEPKHHDKVFDDYSRSNRDAAKEAWNTSPEHVWEHLGPCIGSNQVTVAGPVNANSGCPGPNVAGLAQTIPCKVPEYCQNLPNGPEECTCPTGEFARFDADHVADHFTQQPGPFPMVDVKESTYECVDARGSGPMLGTPGGDLAEVMKALIALLKLTGKSWDKDLATAVFDVFADEVANPGRPLYFHTDDIRLRALFKELRGKLKGEAADYMPSILPFRAPDNEDDAELWIANLKKAEFQGCGHIRLMIEEPTRLEYSVTLEKEAVEKCPNKTAECVDAKRVAQFTIGKFFRYWWPTPSGSPQRRNIAFAIDGILQGPLLGKGVAVISNTPADACPDHAPAIRPTFGGSQLFLYHGDAVGKWRAHVAETYLRDLVQGKYGIPVGRFLETWNAIAGQQLGATLANLVPANRVGIFGVQVPTLPFDDEDEEEGSGPGGKY